MAVKHKHIDVMKTLLQHGGANEPEWRSSSALVLGIESNQYEMGALLLRSGYNVNRVLYRTQDTNMHTPLHYAARSGLQMTKLLLDAKASTTGYSYPESALVNEMTRGDISNN